MAVRRPDASSRMPMGRPSRRTAPAVGTSRWFRLRSSVLLPEPLGPIRHTTSPRAMVREMPFSTSVAPKLLRRSRTSIIGSGMAALSLGDSSGTIEQQFPAAALRQAALIEREVAFERHLQAGEAGGEGEVDQSGE